MACGHCNGGGIDMTLAGWFPLHIVNIISILTLKNFFFKDPKK